MRKISLIALLFFAFAFRSETLRVEKKKITAENKSSSLTYALHHPLHSFDASSKDFRCVGAFDTESSQFSAIAVVVPIKSFDSGNSNRDSHMIEVTEALKFPNVSFSSDEITYTGETATAKGKLTFHGQTKNMSLVAKQKVVGSKVVLTGQFEVDMKEHGIKPPSLMGMDTDKEIKLNFTMTFNI